jgi:hypothetical protein
LGNRHEEHDDRAREEAGRPSPARPLLGDRHRIDRRTCGTATSTTEPATITTTSAVAFESFPPPIVESAGPGQRTLGWLVAGAGAVGIGIGAGFGFSSLSKRGEAQNHCVVNACDPTGIGLRADAIRNGNIATIATIAGGAAAVGGLILVLTAARPGSHRRSGEALAVPEASVVVGGRGAFLQGAF